MDIRDARYERFRAQVPDLLVRIETEEAMEDARRVNDLGRLNDQLFAELENLRAVDVTDADAMDAEVSRAKAVEGIARTVIENANTVLDATRMRAEFCKGASVTIPRMLEG